MLIGRLSELTGVTRKTIRHYESIGLISPPERKGAYRVYSEKYISIIKMIKQAQSLGFTLSELQELVSEKSNSDEFPIQLASDLIDNKLNAINREVDHLALLSQGLLELKYNLVSTFK